MPRPQFLYQEWRPRGKSCFLIKASRLHSFLKFYLLPQTPVDGVYILPHKQCLVTGKYRNHEQAGGNSIRGQGDGRVDWKRRRLP